MSRAAIFLVVLAAVGCKKKEAEPEPVVAVPSIPPPIPPIPEPKAEAPKPDPPKPTFPQPDPWLDAPRRPEPPAPRDLADPPLAFEIDRLNVPSAPITIEALVRDVRGVASATSPELVLARLTGWYVHKNGELDARYGKLDIDMQLLDGVDGVADDPNRPTGAPITELQPVERTRERCPKLIFEAGDWSVVEGGCTKTRIKGGPRCTIAEVWAKAVGAPDNAVAVIGFDARTAMWTFRITDKLRGVNYSRGFRDDCKPAADR